MVGELRAKSDIIFEYRLYCIHISLIPNSTLLEGKDIEWSWKIVYAGFMTPIF